MKVYSILHWIKNHEVTSDPFLFFTLCVQWFRCDPRFSMFLGFALSFPLLHPLPAECQEPSSFSLLPPPQRDPCDELNTNLTTWTQGLGSIKPKSLTWKMIVLHHEASACIIQSHWPPPPSLLETPGYWSFSWSFMLLSLFEMHPNPLQQANRSSFTQAGLSPHHGPGVLVLKDLV